MAWTTPRTWVASETVTASIMNTHVRDNLSALATESTANTADVEDLKSVVGSVNLIADPTFLIWAAGDAAAPSHWGLGTTAATVARCGTGLGDTTRKVGAFCAKLTAGATGSEQLRQNLLGTASYDDFLDGQTVSMGAWVYCTASSSARIFVDDGSGATYSSYATGSTSWQWLTVTRTLGTTGTYLRIGAEAIASASLYLSGPTAVLGDEPPSRYQPAPVVYGTLYFPFVGTVTAKAGAAMFLVSRPTLVKDVQLRLGTAALGSTTSTGAYYTSVDVNTYSTDWLSMFSGSTAQPRILSDTGGTAVVANAQPDGTYARRCLDGSTAASRNHMKVDIDSGGASSSGGAATDLYVMVRCLQFARPLENMLAYNDIT